MESNFCKRVFHLTRFFRCPHAPRPAGRLRFRPALEGLEERALLSTLGVVNLAGSGQGSLHGQLAHGGHHSSGAAAVGNLSATNVRSRGRPST